ncbi:MAG: hypothetical protein LBG11_10875 [Bifidobacteriaceae bacterium]|nr:hypothetical protein [Bifidobacteriaceae bacterium]
MPDAVVQGGQLRPVLAAASAIYGCGVALHPSGAGAVEPGWGLAAEAERSVPGTSVPFL